MASAGAGDDARPPLAWWVVVLADDGAVAERGEQSPGGEDVVEGGHLDLDARGADRVGYVRVAARAGREVVLVRVARGALVQVVEAASSR